MAARKQTAASKAADKAKEVTDPEDVPNGFVVTKQEDAEGNLNVVFFPIGECKVTEAVTILGMAYAGAKRQVGLE